MSDVNVAGLAGYAEKYAPALIRQLVNGMEFKNDMTVMLNVKNNMRLPKLSVAAGVRPFSSSEELVGGGLVFSDRTLSVDPGKREIEIDPEQFRTTYLNLALDPNTPVASKKIPYEQFVWESIVEKIASEINDNTAFNGFDKDDAVAFDSGDTYAAGDYITYAISGITHYYKCLATTTAGQDPEDTPAKWRKVNAEAVTKGVGTLITELVDATSLSEVSVGAITSGSTAVAGMLELFRSFSAAYKKQNIVIHCGYTDFEFLLDGLVDHIKYTNEDSSHGVMADGSIYLPGTARKCVVKPASWIGSSRRLIATPGALVGGQWKSNNLYFGTNLLSDFNKIEIKQNLWTYVAGIKFLAGFQIADLDAIKIGDQD